MTLAAVDGLCDVVGVADSDVVDVRDDAIEAEVGRLIAVRRVLREGTAWLAGARMSLGYDMAFGRSTWCRVSDSLGCNNAELLQDCVDIQIP